MLSLGQLIAAPSEDDVLQTILDALTSLGFQATSWQSGSAQLIMLRLIARMISKLGVAVQLIAVGGFTTLAAQTSGASGLLTLLAKYVYGLERVEAQYTVGKITLTSSAGAPTHILAVGDLIIADAEEGVDGAHSYTLTEGGTLNPGSSLSLEFKADVAGADWNIAPNTTLYLWTPLVGVTATNPALLPDSNTWITTPGEDEESDTRLSDRCMGRWSRLTYGNTDGAYKAWALEALPALQRVTVGSAPGNGYVRVIGATSLGGLTLPQIETIDDYLNGVTDGVGRRPLNDLVTVESATSVMSPTINIVALVVSSVAGTAAAAIVAALQAYIGSLPIGGIRLQGSGSGLVILSEMIKRAQSVTGVRSVEFDITDDIPLNVNEIYQPTINVSVQVVSPGV